ncbi:aconitate hydratase [Desulfomicrobium baculatum]|uniref:Aconitate hydratase A n=1 Tax=Desulfomicrobium baculatum (strain DSM 4028 / VKM B-1378 / X) TaxID=525897 RepID=C7LXN2_DESBD|nr:aconitate hydratase [Desulfomicrobium baculatum]ACU91268.1 aconitate hydratase [Desulfomicrobium baculatum DSM 4028]
MNQNLTQKIIAAHLVEGDMQPGNEVAIKIDQTLTQDATGTMAYLQWEAIGLPRVKTELSVSYVDHNTLQMGFRNPDDHRYLRSVAAKYGIVFSPPGTGICHQLHLENFAVPGKTLIGSDSHTPTAGGIGSLSMGAGGLSVALAMAGEPYTITMPRVFKIRLEGQLTGYASAKDVILHLLGILTVKGGVGAVMEYCGPGVATLSVPERATITNMGAELGATASIFPSDDQTRAFLALMGRESDFTPLAADEGAAYDREIVIDLSALVPLAARPHMPDRVVPVAELDGMNVDQVAIGSCTNSSYSDLQSVAQILSGEHIAPNTDLLLSPGSKQVLKMLMSEGLLDLILDAGGRLMECSCGPCIGMGGSPSSGGVSARTFNRNFEGRSGTQDGQIYLVSPITAAFSALNGKFTNPSTWTKSVSKPSLPATAPSIRHLFAFPPEDGSDVEILRGPNIVALSPFDRLPEVLELPVLIKVGDNITTDHIMPAGAAITALRSNIPAISRHVFERVDKDFVTRAEKAGQGLILGGENYGQGSSREHAALAPRHLGVRVVLTKSFARIHKANLINFGILPLMLANEADYDTLAQGDVLRLELGALEPGAALCATTSEGRQLTLTHDLTGNEIAIIKAGGLLNYVNDRQK